MNGTKAALKPENVDTTTPSTTTNQRNALTPRKFMISEECNRPLVNVGTLTDVGRRCYPPIELKAPLTAAAKSYSVVGMVQMHNSNEMH